MSHHYDVKPRYTAGSPAQVDLETATRVADQERRGYDEALEGSYGAVEREKAERLGLKGIVEERVEKIDCWIVCDLLTSEKFVRMFPPADLTSECNCRTHSSYHLKWCATRQIDNRRTLALRLRAKYNMPVEGDWIR